MSNKTSFRYGDKVKVIVGENKIKNKWYFTFDNEWNFYSWWEFSVEVFGLNIQKDFICIVIFGFAFTWEKLSNENL